MLNKIKNMDKKLFGIVSDEIKRQNETIDLIASENIASNGVLELLGSELTNKYCEGYPSHRYYPGCAEYDKIEHIIVTGSILEIKRVMIFPRYSAGVITVALT